MPPDVKRGKREIKRWNYHLARRTDGLQFIRVRKSRAGGYWSEWKSPRHTVYFLEDLRTGERVDDATEVEQVIDVGKSMERPEPSIEVQGKREIRRDRSERKKAQKTYRESISHLHGPVRTIMVNGQAVTDQ